MTAPNTPARSWTRQELQDLAISAPRTGPRWISIFKREVLDHGFLRHWWKNEAEIAPGVYRSNHPARWRLARFAQNGVKTVLSLRGDISRAPHQIEVEDLADLGMDLVFRGMAARIAPTRDVLLDLIAVLHDLPRPVLIHCKSGADRTGLVSAIFLMEIEGVPYDIACQQLSARFLHFSWSETGILDMVLEMFAEDAGHKPQSFAHWVRTTYDPEKAIDRFAARPRGLARWFPR